MNIMSAIFLILVLIQVIVQGVMKLEEYIRAGETLQIVGVGCFLFYALVHIPLLVSLIKR